MNFVKENGPSARVRVLGMSATRSEIKSRYSFLRLGLRVCVMLVQMMRSRCCGQNNAL